MIEKKCAWICTMLDNETDENTDSKSKERMKE